MLQKVLFICTGNYYRSRFAEVLFNRLAEDQQLPYTAFSRGLRVGNPNNVGMISPFCLQGLKEINISHEPQCGPMQCLEQDIIDADIVIALKRDEHEVMAKQMFPHLVGKIIFWDIHDLDVETAGVSLKKLEAKVREMTFDLGKTANWE